MMDTIYLFFLLAFSGAFAVSSDIAIDIPKAFAFFFFHMLSRQEVDAPMEEMAPVVKAPIAYHLKYMDEFKVLEAGDAEASATNLVNCFVIEYTPLGNVAMAYDSNRESFVYYSDHIIPYRFLEVVARKYALTFHCKHLVVDLEEELKKVDKTLSVDATTSEKEDTPPEDATSSSGSLVEEKSEGDTSPPKRDVFAKFKTYNKSKSGPAPSNPKEQTNMAPPSDAVVAEKSNRYTCDGRFSSFMLLKIPAKKDVDERYTMTFADFKKMQKKNLL